MMDNWTEPLMAPVHVGIVQMSLSDVSHVAGEAAFVVPSENWHLCSCDGSKSPDTYMVDPPTAAADVSDAPVHTGRNLKILRPPTAGTGLTPDPSIIPTTARHGIVLARGTIQVTPSGRAEVARGETKVDEPHLKLQR
jgi:hypothetical protein